MSSPVTKKLVEPEAPRRGDDRERHFSWYTPRKRRATTYEDVTVDVQPSTNRHVDRGWLVCFEDGRGTWDDRSTRLSSEDWYAFRDPGQLWERPYYQQGAALERQIEDTVRSARAHRLFDDFAPRWVEFLRQNLQVPAFVEHGLWLALATAARDCLSDGIANCVAFEAAMKQRMAQGLVLYALDLEGHFGEFPIAEAKDQFLVDPIWQPTRHYLERLQTLSDWGETIVAVNLCFEPMVGLLIRREFGIRAAIANGDGVTPVLSGSSQVEWDWTRGWTAEFVRHVLTDPTHGQDNREVITGWLRTWLPLARQAARALMPLVARLPDKSDHLEESIARVERDATEYFDEVRIGELVKAALT